MKKNLTRDDLLPIFDPIHVKLRILTCLLILVLLPSCQADGPSVTLKNQRYTIEIRNDDDGRELGLMFRQQMDLDHGMLFIFGREKPLSFWMKNTLIPLDILYFDEQLKFVSMHTHVPPCKTPKCPSYPSKSPAKYVLELNAGQASKLNLSTDDTLIIAR